MVKKSEQARCGCLCISNILPGPEADPGLSFLPESPELSVRVFRDEGWGDLWDRLQVSFQDARRNCASSAIVALGTGCAAALALAEQLPVDRLALIDPMLRVPGRRSPGREGLRRVAQRLSRFALSNLALCTSDLLIVERAPRREGFPARLCGFSRHCLVKRLSIESDSGLVWKNDLKQTIVSFLLADGMAFPMA